TALASRRHEHRVQVSPARRPVSVMEGEDFDDLVADIKANGQHEPIVLYDGMILDGRNRYRACLAAGVAPDFINSDGWIDDPAAFVISANIHRRHLSAEEKRDLIAKLITARPEKSNRRIAKEIGVSHPHVAKVRGDLEKSGDVETVTTSIDTKGRKQPKRKGWSKERWRRHHDRRKRGPVRNEENAGDPETSAAAMKVAQVAAIETGINETSPKQTEALPRKESRKEKAERRAAEIERIPSKLIELDPDTARAIHDLFWQDDRLANNLVCALARGLGLHDDDEIDPLVGNDCGPMPDFPRRALGSTP